MLEWILRFFLGYCRFEVETGNPVRLLNRLHEAEIYFWKPQITAAAASFYVAKKSGAAVDQVMQKMGLSASQVGGYGLPFLLRSVRARVIAITVCLLLVGLPLVSRLFVGEITISGNRNVSTESIRTLLAEEGVSQFAYLPSIDLKQVRQRILLRQPKFAWVALNVSGNAIEVLVHEKTGSDYLLPTAPCNIVAACDGIICKMDVLQGKAVVSGKTAVRKGQLLVSGFLETEGGKLSYYHAQATVIAQTTLQKSYTVNYAALDYQKTEETKNFYQLLLFGSSFRLYHTASLPQRPYTAQEAVSWWSVFGIRLPIGLKTTTYEIYEARPSSLTKTDALEILNRSFAEYEATELEDAAIVEKSFSLVEQSGKLTMTGIYEVQMDIAREIPIGLVGVD